jgi:heme exporter protein C
MWGAWWVWDARLTSFLVMFFLYLGYMAIARQADEDTAAQKICAVLAIIGAINLPIIKFSVDWWNTLHQPASIFRAGGPAIDPQMLPPLALMACAFALFYATMMLYGVRAILTNAKIRRIQMRAM